MKQQLRIKHSRRKNRIFAGRQTMGITPAVAENQTAERNPACGRTQKVGRKQTVSITRRCSAAFPASLSLCFLLLGLTGCQSPAAVSVLTRRTDSVYIDKLIPYPLPSDSASVRALVRCDENGQIALRGLEMANTKNVQLLFTIDSLGEVIAQVEVKRDTLYLPSKETIVVRETDRPVPIAPPLSWWENLKIKAGGWILGSVTAFVLLAFGYAVLRRIAKKWLGLPSN